MKAQTLIIEKGTKMTASGHSLTVVGIRRHGVECILEDGRIVTVDFQNVERGIENK